MIKHLNKADLKILAKILFLKIIALIFLFIVRPPTTLITDAKFYYYLTLNPAEAFKPPESTITKNTFFKPIGWALFLYLFYAIYPNWIFWALLFSFIFSTLTLYLLYKATNEKIMWLFFFYPYFLYHSNFPLEISMFTFLIAFSFYYFKKNNFLSNLICNLSGFLRIEGILFSLYLLIKNFKIKNLFLFVSFSFITLYTYGIFYLLVNYTTITPLVAYPRLFIPFLLVFLIEFKDFFTKHFWKILIIWFIFGLTIGYFKVFYEWNILS